MNASSSSIARVALAALLVSLLAGCAGSKGFYAASAQIERNSAVVDNAPDPAAAQAIAAVKSEATYLKLVEQQEHDGLWFASLAHLDALEQRWGVTPASTRLRADALRHTGQLAESRRQYALLLPTPLAAAGYHGLGLVAGSEGDFKQAREMLQQARQRDPTDALLLSDLGYAQLRTGSLAQARIPLMEAMQLQPDQPQVQANVALYLAMDGRGPESEALMAAHNLPAATREAVRLASRSTSSSSTSATPATSESAP